MFYMMSPGVILFSLRLMAETGSWPERCKHCRASGEQKNFSRFCSDMKQRIFFTVPYWNINCRKTPGLRSRSVHSPSCYKKKRIICQHCCPRQQKTNQKRIRRPGYRRRTQGEKTALARIFLFSSAITFHNGTKINNHVPL